MGFSFYNILNGLRLIPKASGTNSNAGDMEFLTSDNKIHVFNGTVDSALATESGATLTDPNITVKVNPIKFEDPGAGTNKVSVSAPSGLAGSYNFVLPPDDGNLDDVLRTDGAGNTSWISGGLAGLLPTGTILDFAGPTAPTGFLLCYGQLVSPATYPSLFALVGYTYGSDTFGTLFGIPDLRGSVCAGRDNMGGVPANRLTGDTVSPDGNTLGASGGGQDVSIVVSNLPSHYHSMNSLGSSAAITNPAITGSVIMNTSAVSGTVGGSDGTHVHAGTFASGTHTHTAGTLAARIYVDGSGGSIFDQTTSTASWTPGTGSVITPGSAGGATTFGTPVVGTTSTPSATASVTSTSSGHDHAFSLTAAAQTQASHSFTITNSTLTGDTGSVGSNTRLNILQPTLVVNKMIKY